MEESEGRIFNVVDSIKGGCGKTTFSIMLAHYLGMYDAKYKTCIMDMDFMGSGLLNLFYNNEGCEEHKEKYDFINQKIRDFNSSAKKFIADVEVNEEIFYITFADPAFESKQEYLIAAKNNYSMAIKYDTLAAGLRKMLSEESIKSQNDNIRNIILDMSPSDDNYSEVIKDVLWNRRRKIVLSGKDKLNYFLVLGCDRSHLAASVSYLKSLLNGDNKIPDNIFIVFNEMFPIDFDKTIHIKRMEEFQNIIKKHCSEKYINKMHFLVMNQHRIYMKFVQAMKELTTIISDSTEVKDPNTGLFGIPIRHYARFLDNKLLEFTDPDVNQQFLSLLLFQQNNINDIEKNKNIVAKEE